MVIATFGGMLQDGDLSYTYDKNGNRKTVVYPDNVTATYLYDFADRQKSLSVQVGAAPALSLAGDATSHMVSTPSKTTPTNHVRDAARFRLLTFLLSGIRPSQLTHRSAFTAAGLT